MTSEQDVNELVEREYPYPIARKFVFVSERPKGWFDRYRRVVDCFEAIVRFSALEMVLEYYRTGATDMEHNTRILSILLNPKTAHGTWVEILRETSKRLEGRQDLFLKEFSGWYTTAGKPTPIVHDTIETYTASRNQFLGHSECTRSEGFYREQYLLELEKLLRLLASLDFLANYQLIVPVRIDGDLVDEYHVGRGARLKTSLNPIRLPGLSLQDSERSVLLLRHPIDADGNNPFLLYPFLLYRYQADQDRDWADLFVFGSCQAERARTKPKSLRFFSYDIGVPPLETSTQGDRYAHLLQAFSQLLNALTVTSESCGKDETPHFSCYFEIQRDEIERLTEGYVSRPDVEQRIVEAAHDTRQGIILVNGGPGTGKSSLAGSLVNQHGWPHHFIVAGDQIRRQPGPIIRSLSWQLNEKYKLGMEIPQHDDNLSLFYGNLLFRVSQPLPENEKAIILIDALDELSDTDQFSLDFIPASIPRGVVFIVTSRNDHEYRELKEGSDQVALDIEVPPVTESEARAMVGTLGDTLTDGEFGALYHTSEGNPLYLDSIRRDFERTGRISISDLPKKMEGIFASYMKRLKKLGDPLIMEVLALVCTFKEPSHAWQLAQILGTREQVLRDRALMPLAQYLQDRGNGLGFFHKGFRDFILDRMPSDDIQKATSLLIRWCNPQGGERPGYAERWLVQHCLDTLNKEAIWSLVQAKNATIRGQLIRGFGDVFKLLHEDEIDQSPLGRLFLELMEQPGPEYLDIAANVITRLKMFGYVNWRTRTAQRIADLWPDNPHAQYEAYRRGMELMSRKERTERLNQLMPPLETDSNNRMLYARVLEDLSCATASLANFEKTIEFMRLLNKNEPGYANLLYSVHNDYAFYLHRYGKLDEAISNYRQAVNIAEARPEVINSQIALMNLSTCYRDIGELEGSLQCLYQALSNRLKSGESLLAPLDLIAANFFDFECYTRSADVYGYTIAYIEATHRSPGPRIVLPLLHKARALIHLERVDEARKCIERGRVIVRDLPAHHGLQPAFKRALSELLIAEGEHQVAREALENLLSYYETNKKQQILLKTCRTTAQLVLSMGDVDSSRRLLGEMEELIRKGNWRLFLPSLYDLRAAIFEKEKEHERAREVRAEADAERKRWRLDHCLAMKMPELTPIRDQNGVVYDLSQYSRKGNA